MTGTVTAERTVHLPLASPGTVRPWAALGRWRRAEAAVALAGFGALCLVVLTKGAALLEPDDLAYRASILALAHGHLVLTTAQYHALAHQLGSGTGIVQWVHLPGGGWISEKNPGYPFFAVGFQLLGLLRLTPLFYGGLACAALYLGGRRWLGRGGGAAAVLLFCSSGAALTFAWRATMPTFTDASLVATGAGLLLWTVLAGDAPRRRRLAAGLGGFVALEAATSIRYTDVTELAVAIAAVLLFARRAGIDRRMLSWWLGTVALFAGAVLLFDALVYGAPLRTGYGTGEITFSLSAIGPNLRHMPGFLVAAMPMTLLAALAVGWIGARAWRRRRPEASADAIRRDLAVGGTLLLGWVVVWALYLAYTWTVGQSASGVAVHVIRFYLPALGPVALLAAWAVVRMRGAVAVPVLLTLGVLGVLSFHGLSAAGLGPNGLPGGPGGPGQLGAVGGPGGGPGGVGGGPPGPPPGGAPPPGNSLPAP